MLFNHLNVLIYWSCHLLAFFLSTLRCTTHPLKYFYQDFCQNVFRPDLPLLSSYNVVIFLLSPSQTHFALIKVGFFSFYQNPNWQPSWLTSQVPGSAICSCVLEPLLHGISFIKDSFLCRDKKSLNFVLIKPLSIKTRLISKTNSLLWQWRPGHCSNLRSPYRTAQSLEERFSF